MYKTLKLYLARHRWLNYFLQIILFLLIIIGISTWQTRNATTGEAPAFSGISLNNEPIILHNYRGKPLLLHFWASWCPICKLEQGSISDLFNASHETGFHVLTIASWSGDEADVIKFMQQENLHFPVIVDQDGSIAKLYGVQGVPSSFIIDADGNIQFVTQGYSTNFGLRFRLWWLKFK